MRRALLLYNPLAGDQGTAGKLDYITGRFQDRGILLQPYRLTFQGSEQLPGLLASGEFEQVVVSGGDGTVNFVSNILMRNKLDMPVGIIPAGTCNDFARSLKIPGSLEDCIEIILEGKVRCVDVGLINERDYFIGTLAGGFFVDVSYSTHHELKRNFGPFAYYLKALTEVANIKGFNIKLTADGETVEEKILLFVVLNGKDVGGFTNVIKEADVSDGLMDILLVKECSHIDLGALFFKVLSPDSLEDRNVIKLKARRCTVEGDEGIATSVDGEKGPSLPMTISFINKALKVFV